MKTLAALIVAVVLAACGPTASEKPPETANEQAELGLGNWTEEFGFGGP